jgi:hypothetical protein
MHVFCPFATPLCSDHQREPHVMWVDNFSKIYRINHITMDSGAYRDCLWTGEAIHRYTGRAAVSMNVMHDRNGQVVPIMPRDMFEQQPRLIAASQAVDAMGSRLYESSLVLGYNVCNIPLKPSVDAQEYPELYSHLQRREDGLGEFYPTRIAKHNPGSNTGLHSYMQEVYEKLAETNEYYKVYKADCNIFSRWMKVSATGWLQLS